jgi:Domain of unknown function (DUF4200)
MAHVGGATAPHGENTVTFAVPLATEKKAVSKRRGRPQVKRTAAEPSTASASLFDFDQSAGVGDSDSDSDDANPFSLSSSSPTAPGASTTKGRTGKGSKYKFTENVARRQERKAESQELTPGGSGGQARGKESLNELVSKKREMFLLEYSLRVKHEEIARLEETSNDRTEDLDQEEQRLKDESASFDRHLKENNLKTMEAMRNADTITKTKLSKAAEAKRLQNEIAALQGDIAHFDDQLAECEKYKEFLDTLRREVEKSPADGDTEESGHASLDYFKDPQTLLDVFKALEEQNMFLIENAQETERVLEAVKQKRRKLESDTEREIEELNQQIQHLTGQISKVRSRASERKNQSRAKAAPKASPGRTATNAWKARPEAELVDLDGEAGTQLLNDLRDRVEGVYERTIGANVADLSPLQMLAKLERHLRDLTARLEKLPPDQIAAAERQREKERRLQARQAKSAQEELEHETRHGAAARKARVAGNTGHYIHSTTPSARKRGTEPALGGLALTRAQRRRNQLEKMAAEAADEEWFFGTG